MNDVEIILPSEKGEHRFRVPDRNLGEILSPSTVAPGADLARLVGDALARPIGCPTLSEQVRLGMKILIVVDDITRSTPTNRIVPILLEYLLGIGCREKDIRFAIALGTHRAMTYSEIEGKLGLRVTSHFHVTNTPAQEDECYVDTGEEWDGVPIDVHRDVIESDIVIGVGSVVPHMNAGWSGGAKIILPGMCSKRTIMENHILAGSFPGNMLGHSSTGVRRNMEAIVERIGLAYVLNAVMTPEGEVVRVMGGHFVGAQRAAVEVGRQIYEVPFRTKADVVVANAFPCEIDLGQGIKGVWAGESLVKRGGVVILNAPCREGIGQHTDYLDLIARERDEIMEDVLQGRVQDKITAANALQIAAMLDHMGLAIVSGRLATDHAGAPPIKLFSSVQDAVDEYLASSGRESIVSVLTHAGCTCPVQR